MTGAHAQFLLEMSKRYIKFNYDTLVEIAVKAVSARSCTSFKEISEGSFFPSGIHLYRLVYVPSKACLIACSFWVLIRGQKLSLDFRFPSSVRLTS